VELEENAIRKKARHRPNSLIEAILASMKVVWAIVPCKNVLLAVQRKFSVSDAVGNTAHYATKVGATAALRLLLMILKPKHNIAVFSVYVWSI
jgi:hypothetical protein